MISIGKIVKYQISKEDAKEIIAGWPVKVQSGERYPMMVTKIVDLTHVDGTVFLDGGFFWAKGVEQGAGPGKYQNGN